MKNNISTKVETGERISSAEALWLLEECPLPDLGKMANICRRRAVGDDAYYQFNYNINYTNICENECELCAFYRSKEEGYCLSVDEIADAVSKIVAAGVNEVHVVGGLNRDIPYSYYLDMLRAIKKVHPSIFIQAFTAVEIAFIAEVAGKSTLDVLRDMKAAGLDSLPGGGAEIFSPRVRDLICKKKISGQRWLEIVEEAHLLDIGSNATMLYGHVETTEEIIDHLNSLRSLQDKTGKFKAFVPLAFFPRNTKVQGRRIQPGGIYDMRLLATSRIFLDNFPHLKAMWMIYGYKACQVGLDFGADDIGGTYYDENIVHAAGAKTPRSVTRSEICTLITSMQRFPIQVNSRYETIKRGA